MFTILQTVDIFVFVATVSSFVTLSITGYGSIVILMSTGIACGLPLTKKFYLK